MPHFTLNCDLEPPTKFYDEGDNITLNYFTSTSQDPFTFSNKVFTKRSHLLRTHLLSNKKSSR